MLIAIEVPDEWTPGDCKKCPPLCEGKVCGLATAPRLTAVDYYDLNRIKIHQGNRAPCATFYNNKRVTIFITDEK